MRRLLRCLVWICVLALSKTTSSWSMPRFACGRVERQQLTLPRLVSEWMPLHNNMTKPEQTQYKQRLLLALLMAYKNAKQRISPGERVTGRQHLSQSLGLDIIDPRQALAYLVVLFNMAITWLVEKGAIPSWRVFTLTTWMWKGVQHGEAELPCLPHFHLTCSMSMHMLPHMDLLFAPTLSDLIRITHVSAIEHIPVYLL